MDAAWSGDDQPVVGIVNSATATGIGTELVAAGDDAGQTIRAKDALEDVLAAHDATTVRGGLEDVLAAEPSLLVTGGAGDLSAVARAAPDRPVLPVGDVDGIETVDRERFSAALDAVFEGAASEIPRPILTVTDDEGTSGGDDDTDDGLPPGDTGERALFDVTLVTDEPARISEYRVTSRGERVSQFRADGIVVATPAGSHGYASAVDAPLLSPAVDAVAVAPIAPFVTQTRRWVLPDDEIGLAVARDEGDVTLVVDDRPVRTVPVDSPITVGVDETLTTLTVPDDALETG